MQVLAMHMAEGVRDETLLELNLGILVTIRQNPNALGEVAAAAMDLFTHVRPGRSGISKGEADPEIPASWVIQKNACLMCSCFSDSQL